jgi:hypothetical protein
VPVKKVGRHSAAQSHWAKRSLWVHFQATKIRLVNGQGREVIMKSPLVIVLVAVVLITVGTLAVMNKARKLTAVVVLTSFSNISMIGNGRNHLRPPAIGRTVTVELQRHSPVAKVEAPSKDVSPVVATAEADAEASKPHRPKVLARNYERPGY